MKMFTHVCICTCTSETLVMCVCVYLACSLLESFEGAFSQVQLKTGIKLEGWDFLADLKEAFTAYTTRIIYQKHVDLSQWNWEINKCDMWKIYLSCFKKHSIGGELLWASSKVPRSFIPLGYLQTVKVSISYTQTRPRFNGNVTVDILFAFILPKIQTEK